MESDNEKILQEGFHIGSGVERVWNDIPADTTPKSKKEQLVTDEDGVTYILNAVGVRKYSSRPTFKGQYKDIKLWKAGPLVAKVFHSNVPEEFDEYNALLKKSSEFEDPAVAICSNETQFWRGNFVVFVTYREIFYSVLINKQ